MAQSLSAEGKELCARANRYLDIVLPIQQEIVNIENNLNRQSMLYKQLQASIGRAGAKGALQDSWFTDTSQELYQTYKNLKTQNTLFLQGEKLTRIQTETNNFQQYLVSLLGKQIETVAIYVDGGEVKLYGIKSEDILRFEKGGHGGISARFPSSAKQMQKALAKVGKDIAELELPLDEEGYKIKVQLDKIYKEILYRYNSSLKAKTPRIVLWWYPNTDYDNPSAMEVSSLGDITEAYAAILFARQNKMIITSNMEQNIDTYMNNYVAQVDNISGLFQGDITDTRSGIEYAIKSANASTMSVKQVIELAQIIKSSGGSFTVEHLRQVAENLSKKTQGQRQKILTGKLGEKLDFDKLANLKKYASMHLKI